MKRLLLITFLFACFGIYGCKNPGHTEQGTHPSYKLESIQKEFAKCVKHNGSVDCKGYIAKAICGHFQINDFVLLEEEDQYMPYDEIPSYLENSSDWKLLGKAKNQKVLDEAQQIANEGGMVLAVSKKAGQSNVAIVVKGEQAKSGSWGLNCPSVAFFFPNDPQNSFIGKSLNYAWSKPDGIKLYVRR